MTLGGYPFAIVLAITGCSIPWSSRSPAVRSQGEATDPIGDTARVADAQLKDSLKGINNDVRALAQERDDERNRLQTTVNQNLATITQLQVSVANLQQTNADQLKTIADLKKKLETTAPAVSSATPLSLANSFKSVIDTIQTQARQTPGVATTMSTP